MNPDETKHVTRDNVTTEDVKPEGRTDGPKNFGPEYTLGPNGQVVPTRPNEVIERTARAIAQGARADGKSEVEVVKAFAAVMPEEHLTPIAPSAQPVPDIVPGSMSHADRAKHEEEHKTAGKENPLDQIQYDLGVSLAQSNKALPLEAHECLVEGYEDTREAMKQQLQQRREREITGNASPDSVFDHEGKAGGGLDEKQQADYDAGFGYAQAGAQLPEDASDAMKAGFKAGSK